MRLKLILALALLVAVAALAACGGGDDEADKVEQTARAVTTDKTAVCERLTTTALAAYARKRGAKALSICERKVKNDNFPTSADIEVVNVAGNQASVGYRTSDDITGAMTLRKVNGRWLMNQVVSIAP